MRNVTRRRVLQGVGVGAAVAGLKPFAWAASSVEEAPSASVWGGRISGYRAGTGQRINAFKGIPYGIDTRRTRFQPPQRVSGARDNVRACIEWSARAPQQSPDRRATDPLSAGFSALDDSLVHYHLPPDQGPQSEDCLHVNVWTPGLRDGRKRPVLFYIHGGGYNNGTVNAEIYDGTRLAERGDVVVVTVNHRLNAFGYMYLAALPGLEERYRDSGNVGMLDLVLALEWVRENIAEFGGDPGSVTIFGQSGGGAKCATLMAMPVAMGLFHRVLTMSGQQVSAAPAHVSTERTRVALAAMGLKPGDITADKLDALTVEQIQAGARTMGNWMPVRDDVTLQRDPFSPDAPVMSAAVPMILGNTKDEVFGASAWQRASMTWETLEAELAKTIAGFKGPYSVGEIVTAYRGWYPAYTPNDVFTAAMAAFRSWPGQVIEAERRASHPLSANRTWVYQIDFPSPTANGRAPHTEDIAFVFDNLVLSPGVVGHSERDLAAAQPLATMMSSMLIQFAKTGDPNFAGMPKWPVYSLKDRETMLFDKVSKVVDDPRGDERRMMVGALYRQPGT